jgi:type IV pilus assembly protein PilB
MARLRTDEHLSAQDGRLHLSDKTGGEEMTVRVSIVPVINGEKVVMRLLAKHARQFSLTELGMSPGDLAKVRMGMRRPFGMILSTGPTGSGKTTTIYAALKILNTRDRNIATIEDPVEYVVDGINQIQVNAKTNLTFAAGLRSLLRQDPDVLFVGEIRDEETADIAVNAAMTGHLVLSTMHTNDAVTTIPRLVDMKIEPFLAAGTVNVIIGQRLVREICSHCKASVELVRTATGWKGDPTDSVLLASLDPALVQKYFGKKTSVRVYRGTGCSACHHTGYQGRFGIFEVLEITPKMSQLITAKADSQVLAAQAAKDGMTTMLEDGLQKIISGRTTLSEIMRVTRG